MASELSKFIEDELANKGWRVDDEEAPQQALLGALRVEARVKEKETSKKLAIWKRGFCVGGGVIVVILVWLLILKMGSSAGNFEDVNKAKLDAGINFKPSPSPVTKRLTSPSPQSGQTVHPSPHPAAKTTSSSPSPTQIKTSPHPTTKGKSPPPSPPASPKPKPGTAGTQTGQTKNKPDPSPPSSPKSAPGSPKPTSAADHPASPVTLTVGPELHPQVNTSPTSSGSAVQTSPQPLHDTKVGTQESPKVVASPAPKVNAGTEQAAKVSPAPADKDHSAGTAAGTQG